MQNAKFKIFISLVILIIFGVNLHWQQVGALEEGDGDEGGDSITGVTEFGGKITERKRKFCIFNIPGTPFPGVIPFLYFEIGPPKPAKLYYVYAISKTFNRKRLKKTAWALGTSAPQGDDAFRQTCTINKSTLPDADGVILKVGTSCKENEQLVLVGTKAKCKKILP